MYTELFVPEFRNATHYKQAESQTCTDGERNRVIDEQKGYNTRPYINTYINPL